MRYCPPPDLGMRVRSNPMAVVDAVSTGIKLASAIETAHRSGILHRDIKPSNVLVTTYHEPALTDFGIAGHIADVDGRERRPHLLPVVAARAARRPVQRLGRLRRLLARCDDLAPAGRPLAVLDPGRRQLDPGPQRPHPARRSPGHPALRRPAGARPAAAAVPGQEPRAPSAERARAGAQPAADRGRRPTGRAPPSPSRATAPTPRWAPPSARARRGPHGDEGGHRDLRLRAAPHRHRARPRRRPSGRAPQSRRSSGRSSAVVAAAV